MNRIPFSLILVSLVTVLQFGCGPSSDSASTKPGSSAKGIQPSNSSASKSKKVIALSILTSANPFFLEISDSVKAKAAEAGYDVVSVSGEMDASRQQNQVKDFIVQRVSAIILTPCDSRAVGSAIIEANQAGIPVFTADIASIAPNAKVVTHIATDNYSGGRQAAQAVIEALGGSGKVAIIDFPQVESVMLRTEGFRHEIAQQEKEKGTKIEIVASLPGDGAKDRSFKATQDLLQSHPEVEAIFAINDPSALGCYAALEGAGKAGQIKIIGFDGQIDGKKAIRDGKIYADPIQFPKKIGEETVATILKYLDGQEVPPTILIPTELYRQADGKSDPQLR